MTNWDFCHQFFYDDFTSYKGYGNMHYDSDKFYSYSTIIGKVIERKQGNVLLISKETFSATTSKHISYLKQACPFGYAIVKVPVDIGQYDIDPNKLPEEFCSELDSYAKQGFTTASVRNEFRDTLDAMEHLVELGIIKVRKTTIKKYEKLWTDNTDPEKLKQEKAKKAAATRKANEKLRKELANTLSNVSYLEQIEMAYSYWSNCEFKDKLKKILNPENKWSFIWKTDSGYETSKGLRLDAEDIDVALRLYKHGKLKHGMKIDKYTVMEVTADHVTVGCHKVPVENIKAIMEDADI